MVTTSPKCTFCKHFQVRDWSCTAFPKGVPDDLVFGDVSHDEPYPGDHGIRFELNPDLDADDLDLYNAFYGNRDKKKV